MTRSKWVIRFYVGAIVTAAVFAVKSGLLFGVPIVSLATIASLTGLALSLELGGVNLAHKTRGSVAFIVYIAVAILVGPSWAAVVAAISVLAADLAQRKELIRVVFNVAQRVLGISVGTQVFILLGGSVPFASIEV